MGKVDVLEEEKVEHLLYHWKKRRVTLWKQNQIKGKGKIMLHLPAFFGQTIKILSVEAMETDMSQMQLDSDHDGGCGIQSNQRNNGFAGKMAKQKECLYWKRSA